MLNRRPWLTTARATVRIGTTIGRTSHQRKRRAKAVAACSTRPDAELRRRRASPARCAPVRTGPRRSLISCASCACADRTMATMPESVRPTSRSRGLIIVPMARSHAVTNRSTMRRRRRAAPAMPPKICATARTTVRTNSIVAVMPRPRKRTTTAKMRANGATITDHARPTVSITRATRFTIIPSGVWNGRMIPRMIPARNLSARWSARPSAGSATLAR